MSLFGLFRRREAPAAAAKERLRFVLQHERAGREAPDYLPRLQKDILAAIARYVSVEDDQVSVRMTQDGGNARLEVNIELPPAPLARRRA